LFGALIKPQWALAAAALVVLAVALPIYLSNQAKNRTGATNNVLQPAQAEKARDLKSGSDSDNSNLQANTNPQPKSDDENAGANSRGEPSVRPAPSSRVEERNGVVGEASSGFAKAEAQAPENDKTVARNDVRNVARDGAKNDSAAERTEDAKARTASIDSLSE